MKKYKAVFIDDDKGIIDALNLYADLKHIPLLACHPEQAKALVKVYEPEVIFFDYLMAGTDGPALLAEIQSNIFRNFKAVLVTAHPLVTSSAKDKFAGWIKKPFTFDELQKYVN